MIKFCNRNKISFLATKYIYLQLFQYKNIEDEIKKKQTVINYQCYPLNYKISYQ